MKTQTTINIAVLALTVSFAAQSAHATINVPVTVLNVEQGFPDLLSDNPILTAVSDNLRCSVAGEPIGNNRSGIEIHFGAINPVLATVRPSSIKVNIEARRRPTGDVNVFLFDFRSQVYRGLGAMNFNGIDAIRSRTMSTNVSRFISEVGGIDILVQSRTSARPHRLEVDRIAVFVD